MSAYYNEFDPKAAAWLRALIAAGLLPPGEVDERSIVDVRATDVRGYHACHFFAGIGGWPHALRLAGWPDSRPVWTGSCESGLAPLAHGIPARVVRLRGYGNAIVPPLAARFIQASEAVRAQLTSLQP